MVKTKGEVVHIDLLASPGGYSGLASVSTADRERPATVATNGGIKKVLFEIRSWIETKVLKTCR